MREVESRRLHLLCHKKKNEAYTVTVLPGWFPSKMRPLFDEHFESAPLLLDFEHLTHTLQRRGGSCEITESKYGSREIYAEGKSALAVISWLGGAMASGLVPST